MVTIHFLNVGHGDCTIIEHASGNLTMIDINNGDDIDRTSAKEIAKATYARNAEYRLSQAEAYDGRRTAILKESAGYDIELTNPVEFVTGRYAGRPLFRYIQSHPDLDHMRGLGVLRRAGVRIWNFWDTAHDKLPEHFQNSDEEEWEEYAALRSGKRGVTVLRLHRENRGAFWNQLPGGLVGGDGLHILAPTPKIIEAANESGNSNNLSYVLWFEYQGIKVVLGGDAEAEVWDSIYATYGRNLKCHVLKASHHGRDSGYHQEAVKAMSPPYTIVSVGNKPETDASYKYRQYSDNVWSTRWRGNIALTIDDQGRATISSQHDR